MSFSLFPSLLWHIISSRIVSVLTFLLFLAHIETCPGSVAHKRCNGQDVRPRRSVGIPHTGQSVWGSELMTTGKQFLTGGTAFYSLELNSTSTGVGDMDFDVSLN